MSSPVLLVINRQASFKSPFVSKSGSATTFPDLCQGDTKYFNIQVVDPDPLTLGGYTIVNLAGTTAKLWFGPDPTGTTGGPAQVAAATLTWDSTNLLFTGSLDLTISTVDTFIAAAALKAGTFEITLIEGSGRTKLFQGAVTVYANGDEATTTTPAGPDIYPTLAIANGLYLPRVGAPGDVWIAKSPSGLFAREFGVDDNGSRVDSVYPIP